MRIKNIISINYLLIQMLFFVCLSCSPKVEKLDKAPDLLLPQGAKLTDIKLKDFADLTYAKDNIKGSADSKGNLKQIQNSLEITKIKNNPADQQKYLDIFNAYQKSLKFENFKPENSVYLDLVYDLIHSQVDDSVKNADKSIVKDSEKLISKIRDLQKKFILNPESSLEEKINVTEVFLNGLASEVKKMKIIDEFKKMFLEQLNVQTVGLLKSARNFNTQLNASVSLDTDLTLLKNFITEAEIQLSETDQKNLVWGAKLVETLKSMNDPETALQGIAIIWILLDEQQRVTYIKTANEKLFNFLSERSEADILCLTEKNCKGFKSKIVLSFGVYPAIEKYGVENIKNTINQQGHDFIKNKVNATAFDNLQKVGEIISEKTIQSVNNKRQDLADFSDNLRGNLSKGLSNKFQKLKLSTISSLNIDNEKNLTDLETQSLILRLKASSLSWIKDQKLLLKTQFELLENFLLLPLFSQTTDIVNSNQVLRTDLASLILNPNPRYYSSSLLSKPSDILVNDQTHMINLASDLINQFSDWNQSSFDQGLSVIKAQEILTQFKAKELEQAFFDKANLLTLSISISSQVLKFMQSEYSPLILVDNQDHIIPVKLLNNENLGPIALSAATDIKNGVSTKIVKSSDLSLFLTSLIRFYQATEGIEKTKSLQLTEIKENGKRYLDELIIARKNIKLLIVATANFLSNKMIQSNRLVTKNISLSNDFKPSVRFMLLDQTRTIEALIKSYELTQIDVYLWSALDIFYAMNRNLYSRKIKFYIDDTSSEIQTDIDKNNLLETYKSLLLLKPYLPIPSQNQLEKIYEGWLKENL